MGMSDHKRKLDGQQEQLTLMSSKDAASVQQQQKNARNWLIGNGSAY